MGERFSSFAEGVASGTNKTIINMFNPLATPTRRGKIYDFAMGSVAVPADQAVKIGIGRTTGIGTEGAGFVPVNIDPGGPAGEYDSGNAHSAEPTYTSNKELFVFSLNQRATFRWVAAPGGELVMTATQNCGLGIKARSSTSTQAHELTVFHEE
jgi:hypothetical protein